MKAKKVNENISSVWDNFDPSEPLTDEQIKACEMAEALDRGFFIQRKSEKPIVPLEITYQDDKLIKATAYISGKKWIGDIYNNFIKWYREDYYKNK